MSIGAVLSLLPAGGGKNQSPYSAFVTSNRVQAQPGRSQARSFFPDEPVEMATLARQRQNGHQTGAGAGTGPGRQLDGNPGGGSPARPPARKIPEVFQSSHLFVLARSARHSANAHLPAGLRPQRRGAGWPPSFQLGTHPEKLSPGTQCLLGLGHALRLFPG